MPTNQRIAYLDFIKGVCIILLVSFHIQPTGHELHQTFLMPTFFFLSGLNFKTYASFNDFLRRKINTLIVPFVFFLTLGAIYYFCRNLLESHFAVGQAFGRMPLNPVDNNTPMWFLMVLFMVNIIYYGLSNFFSRWLTIVLSLALGIVGYIIASNGYVIIAYLDMAFVALPFFMLGNEASKLGILTYRPPILVTLALLVSTILWVYFDTPVINMLRRDYPSALLLFVMTPMVILSLFFVCQYVKRPVPLISYWGRYSLIVLGTHYLLIGWLRMIANKFYGNHETYVWCSVLVVTMILEILVIYFLKKYLPRFTAQKEFFYKGWKLR